LRAVGDEFLGGCEYLAQLDLSAFRNVTYVGDAFLYDCISLTHLDLSPLGSVTEIGDYFLECNENSGPVTLSRTQKGGVVHRALRNTNVRILENANDWLQNFMEDSESPPQFITIKWKD
jgi:hypothetical protein